MDELEATAIRELVKLREQLRAEGKYDEADGIREKLEAEGVDVEDTPDGPRVRQRQ